MKYLILGCLLMFSTLLMGQEATKSEPVADNSSSISTSKMKIAVTGGLSYGVGDAYENTDLKAGIHLGGIFNYDLSDIQPNLSAEAMLVYTYYKGDEVNNYEYSFGMLEILLGVNYSVTPQLSVIGGLGLYRFMFEMEYVGPIMAGYPVYGDYDYSETYLGFFAGAAFSINEQLSVRGTLHFPDFDPDVLYIRLNAAYSFQL